MFRMLPEFCIAITHSKLPDTPSLADFFKGLKPSKISDILHTHVRETNGCDRQVTPLFLAVCSGELEIVKCLVDVYSVDIYQHPSIVRGKIESTLLSEAAVRDHLDIAEFLLQRGVDIDEVNSRGETALFAACHCNQLRMVQFLLSKKARADVTTVDGETCLFAACRSNHEDVVNFLLQAGVDPNHRSLRQSTPLHAASFIDAVDIMEILLAHGAVVTNDTHGISPLAKAALCAAERCFKLLLPLPCFSHQEKITALELAGGMLSDTEPWEAYKHFRLAMAKRYRDPTQIILKPTCPPVPHLGNMTESQTLQELEVKRCSRETMQVEGLLVLERILGTDHIEVGKKYASLIRALYRQNRCSEALALWKQVRRPSRWMEVWMNFDGLASSLFREMMDQGLTPSFSDYTHVLQPFIQEFEGGMHPCVADNTPTRALCGVLSCLTHMWGALQVARDPSDRDQLQDLIRRFLVVAPQMETETVLSVAIKHMPFMNAMESNDWIHLFLLLIQHGADTNEHDFLGDSPLHVICRYSRQVDMQVCKEMVKILLDNGAHVDARNKDNMVPEELTASRSLRALLQRHHPLPLTCLAASAVAMEGVPFHGQVPKVVAKFIQIHSSCKD